MHQQHMRSARDIRMDRDWGDKFVILAVEVVEMVAPYVFDVARIDESMTIRRLFDEHHRRQIIDVPIGRNLNQPCLRTVF